MSAKPQSSLGRLLVLAERLRSPGKMAVAVIGGILAAAVFLGYMPAEESARVTRLRLDKAQKRADLGDALATLRSEHKLYTKLVPKGVSETEWTDYLQSGVGKCNVRLVLMEPKPSLTLGPCEALTWAIEVEGSYDSLCEYVRWLESGERLLRIDRVAVEALDKQLSMSLLVKGLVRK